MDEGVRLRVICVHPDRDSVPLKLANEQIGMAVCESQALWYVWQVGNGGAYTYSCTPHLIDRLRSEAIQIEQIRRIA